MRLLILGLFTILLVSTAPVSDEAVSQSVDRARTLAATAFVNDSVIVEVGEEGPEEPPPETTVQTGETSSSPTTPDEEGGSETQPQATIPDDTSSESVSEEATNNTSVVTEVEVTTQTNTSSNTETTPSTDAGASETESSTQTTVSAEEILAALLGNQAVVARSNGGGGGFFGSTPSGTDITFNARRVRESLRARGITTLSIPNAGSILGASSGGGQRLTQSDFTLFLSSALLRDENIGDVRLRDGELTTEYRALGRLFGFIPMRYTLRVSLSWNADTVDEISIRFPWYKFFLKTGVSRSALEALLESEVNRTIKGQEAEFDVATRAFTAMAEVLANRVGV